MENKQNLDFLAIGDITTDAFIRLKEAEIRCDHGSEDCKLCVSYGDKIPYEFVEIVRAVGNSANAAVSASRLGLTSAFLGTVGDDQNGKECIESLQKDKVVTDYINIDKDQPTNYHYVLWYDVDRTILVKHAPFKYKIPEALEMNPSKWIYLSSLGDSSLEFHEQIVAYILRHPEIRLAFQPGTFQIKLGTEKLKDIYARTEIFFCNVNEAERILGITSASLPVDQKEKVLKLMEMIRALGPKIVSITDGIDGASVYDGTEAWYIPVYPHEPYDRTGAGDAFSSTFTSALILGKSIEEALMWGPINSMSVVQYIGAQKGLLSREALLDYLAKAPENYKPKKIN
ncbi:MAG: PfkB family carbohydrate kinase [Candidatus Paceibacterota bacterium]|jgi:ribokinase